MTKEQKEEYAKLHKDAGDLLTLAATEKRELTAEEKSSQEARYKRMDVLKAEYEAQQRHARYAFENGNTTDAAGGPPQQQAREEFRKNGGDAGTRQEPAEGTAEYTAAHRAAINHFLRTGQGNQRFAITSAGNSVLVPTQVLPPTVIRRNNNAFRLIQSLTGYQPIETSDTAQVTLPVFDDTGVVGSTPAENSTADITADSSTTASVTLNATLYSSKSRWFSNTLLNANGFDILSYVIPIVQKAVDKTQEAAYTTRLMGLTGSGVFQTASKTSILYTELLNLEHALPVAYRSDAGFILSDSLYRLIRGLVDNNNRPVMDLDPVNVFQARIHNRPVAVSDYLAATGTSQGIAGAFLSGAAIMIRDVVPQRLTRYVNVPQYEDQTGYNLFANGDCQFVASAVALLKLSA